MAGEFTPWKTSDYFDPFPGLAAGRAMRQQRESEQMHRDAIDQQNRDREVREQYENQKLAIDNAQLAGKFGIAPVIGPDGRPDPMSTAKLGALENAKREGAAALGKRHALLQATGVGDNFPMTEAEEKLTHENAYNEAKVNALFDFEYQKVKHAAVSRAYGREDEQGNPIPVSINGKQFIETRNGALIEVTPRSKEATATRVVDEATGKPVRGLWNTSDGKIRTVPPSLSEQFSSDFDEDTTPGVVPKKQTGPIKGDTIIDYSNIGKRVPPK